MKKCKSCSAQVPDGQSHYCPNERRTIESDDEDFLLSLAIGAATDSGLLGGLVGGSLTGGLLGDALDGDSFD